MSVTGKQSQTTTHFMKTVLLYLFRMNSTRTKAGYIRSLPSWAIGAYQT